MKHLEKGIGFPIRGFKPSPGLRPAGDADANEDNNALEQTACPNPSLRRVDRGFSDVFRLGNISLRGIFAYFDIPLPASQEWFWPPPPRYSLEYPLGAIPDLRGS
jgi:hypothetical protein